MHRWVVLALLASVALAPSVAAERVFVEAPDADLPAWACVPEDPLCAPAPPPAPAPDAWVCVPESLACHVGALLCPRFGMTAGWCVDAEAGEDGMDAGFAAGLWRGPRGGAGAEALLVRDAEQVERAEVEVRYDAAWCVAGLLPPLVAMQLPQVPLPLPAPSCDVREDSRVSVEP